MPITTRDRAGSGIAGSRSPDDVPAALAGVAAELAQYARAFEQLKRTDMLIVPGTGLLPMPSAC